ncbi:MAG: beta-ketoacyl-ACP synthase II [Bacteriovoracaceae bacterium]
MTRKVAITGIGLICGLGHDKNSVWNGITEGKSGISLIENLPTEDLVVKIAGEVKNYELDEDILSAKDAARYDRFVSLALGAAGEAVKDSNILDSGIDPYKFGSILGVGMGGIPEVERSGQVYLNKGPRRISPFFIPAIIPNMPPGLMSIRWGLKGQNYAIASACASASHAISAACFEIMSGRQDAVITGGAESVISHLPITGFTNMKALSRRNDEPRKASRPFDIGRDGFVMGEGAGILVLEELERAKARGATIYAEVVGHGSTSDAHHITAPHPEGEGASACMRIALESAGISPEQVGYINAHGTSTPLGDIAETQAIKKTFGDHAHNLKVSSSKSMTGHLLGAAGGVETIFCALALHNKTLPPTANLENQDEKCDLNYIPNKAINEEVEYALNNSFGFGGTNSSLILKKH